MVASSPPTADETDVGPLTVDDLGSLDLPEVWELVEGRVIELSPTGAWSGRVSLRFASHLLSEGEAKGLGYAFGADTGFILFTDRRTMRAPDASFVRRERLPDAGPAQRAFLPFPPDLAVEVLSPSDRLSDALAKAVMYLQAGVRLVWLADPDRKTVTVFTPDAPPVTLAAGDTLDGGDVLPDLRIAVAELFAP
jgi:Uma2 family endonuclease